MKIRSIKNRKKIVLLNGVNNTQNYVNYFMEDKNMFKFTRNYKTEETAYVKNVKEDGTEEYVETKIPSYGTEEVGLVGFIKGMKTDGPVLKDTTGTPKKESHLLRNVAIFGAAVVAAGVGYHMITKNGDSANGDQVLPGQAPQQIPMPTAPQQIQMENPYAVPTETFVAAEPEVVNEPAVTPEVTEV